MAIVKEQYMVGKDIIEGIRIPDISVNDLISADTYNEYDVFNNFKKFKESEQLLLVKCAIHISVIGSGNKTFGKIREGDKVLEISDVLKNMGIVYNRNMNEKYEPGTLSARRLVRLLRFHIYEFIEKTKRPSYLWFKYSDKNEKMISICFPGSEHMIEKEDEAIYLLNVYKNLDERIGTKFVERLSRVFIARGVLRPQFFLTHK